MAFSACATSSAIPVTERRQPRAPIPQSQPVDSPLNLKSLPFPSFPALVPEFLVHCAELNLGANTGTSWKRLFLEGSKPGTAMFAGHMELGGRSLCSVVTAGGAPGTLRDAGDIQSGSATCKAGTFSAESHSGLAECLHWACILWGAPPGVEVPHLCPIWSWPTPGSEPCSAPGWPHEGSVLEPCLAQILSPRAVLTQFLFLVDGPRRSLSVG